MTSASCPVEICDRLNDVIFHLSAVDYALLGKPGIEMSDRVCAGFCMILHSQIREIDAVVKELTPPREGAGR